MNIGNIVTQGLLRAQLSVADMPLRDMATQMLDEIIQAEWNEREWLFAKSFFSLNTANGVEEYALDKLTSGPQGMLPNSFRGTAPIRNIIYQPSMEFYRRMQYDSTGNPYYYREGDVRGFQTQVSASSTITFSSSLTNYTTGTVSVIYGSRRVILAAGTITLDMLGRYFRVGSDTKRYRITSFDSATIFYLEQPYEGVTASGASYAIGDVNQKGLVQGYNNSGVLIEEEVQLNGATAVLTTNSFQAINRISKSDKTHGSITATSNGGGVTNAVLDPGETEVDYYTVKLYPIPTSQETLTYENFIRHPHLWKPTDSPLFPNQYHPLLVSKLYVKLMVEWREKDASQTTLDDIEKMKDAMVLKNNDTSNWKVQQETEADSETYRNTNLPANFGSDDGLGY